MDQIERESFKKIVQDFICPMLTGSQIVDFKEVSKKGYSLAVIIGGGQTLHLRPQKDSSYILEIKREQPFKADDTAVIKHILEEIVTNYKKREGVVYGDRVTNFDIEVGLCKHLSPSGYLTIYQIIDKFDTWAARTYEGRKVTFGIAIDFSNKQAPSETYPSIIDVLDLDFCALLSNGVESVLKISAKGAVLSYENLNRDSKVSVSTAPFRFEAFANFSSPDIICISLTNIGEILIFKEKNLLFSKRRGIWNYLNHQTVLHRMSAGDKEVRRAIYETLLDVSFSRTGGCIACVKTTELTKIIKDKIIKEDDLVLEKKETKSKTLNILINGKKFQELDRVLRKEILAIDGATIIDYRGNIIAAGAIIKIRAGSSGGGRLAATKRLSGLGNAIKISADGMVKGFKDEKELFQFG